MPTKTGPVLGGDPSVRIVLALEGTGLPARLPAGKASRRILPCTIARCCNSGPVLSGRP
jgi:hypothetical protein